MTLDELRAWAAHECGDLDQSFDEERRLIFESSAFNGYVATNSFAGAHWVINRHLTAPPDVPYAETQFSVRPLVDSIINPWYPNAVALATHTF